MGSLLRHHLDRQEEDASVAWGRTSFTAMLVLYRVVYSNTGLLCTRRGVLMSCLAVVV